jgi:hypothetical protein
MGWVGNGSNPRVELGWVKKYSRLGCVGLADIIFRLGWVGLKKFVVLDGVGFWLGFSSLAGLRVAKERVPQFALGCVCASKEEVR